MTLKQQVGIPYQFALIYEHFPFPLFPIDVAENLHFSRTSDAPHWIQYFRMQIEFYLILIDSNVFLFPSSPSVSCRMRSNVRVPHRRPAERDVRRASDVAGKSVTTMSLHIPRRTWPTS